MSFVPNINSATRNFETPSSTEHIFRSKLPDITIPNDLPLHTYCFQNLSQYPNRTCLIDGNKSYTFAETRLISRRVASGLSNLMGIAKNDVVMVLLHNCAEFVFTFFGASMIGAVTTTANPSYTAKDIFKQFDASKSKIIVTHSQYVHKFRSERSDLPIMITIDDPPQGCQHFSLLSEAKESDAPSVEVEPNDTVVLPFSSGTTGMPKGVILTHKNLTTCVAQQVDGENPNFYLKEDDVVLCVLPLFHIYSFSMVLLCSLRSGVAMLLTDKSKTESMSELIQRHRVSVAVLVPPLVVALAKTPVLDKFDLSSIRMVMSGAAPLGKELEAALVNRLPQAILGQGYGMTEAGPVISMSPLFAKQPLPTKSGSCGTVVRNAELKVVDPNTGMSLPRNQPGEICIRGPQIMKGYLNNADATSGTIDVHGWLHTGDIGFVDDDDDIFIIDRIKELIKFKGFQVPPAEIEAILLSHPNIADAAVVPKSDATAGEVPVAFVVRSDGYELTEEAVKEFIAKQVVFYKRLHSVYFVNAIPRSRSGKILRNELRAKLASSVTVVEVATIIPTVAPDNTKFLLPLTFFDMVWYNFRTNQQLLLFKNLCSTSLFLQTMVPHFKRSLSLTFAHFLPLAGNIIHPRNNSGMKPRVSYTPDDTFSCTFAIYEGSPEMFLNHVDSTEKPHLSNELYCLSPKLPASKCNSRDGSLACPALALQVTLFPGQGISIGVVTHHGVSDAYTVALFMRAWALIHKHIATNINDDHSEISTKALLIQENCFPFYGRETVGDVNGLESFYWDMILKNRFSPAEYEKHQTLITDPSFGKVRSTFILTKVEIQNLKKFYYILADKHNVHNKKKMAYHLTSFVVTCALIWICNARVAATSGDQIVDPDEPEYFGFLVDCRGRCLNPPLPGNYFGNCVGPAIAVAKHGELKGDDGFAIAVESIAETIKERVQGGKNGIIDFAQEWPEYPKIDSKRQCWLGGTPKFDFYEPDFGWGRAKKYVPLFTDNGDCTISLNKARDLEGALEITLSKPNVEMEAFAAAFHKVLEDIKPLILLTSLM